MTNRSGRIGADWERKVADWIKALGFPHADRRVKTGAKDTGDIGGLLGVVIEAKAERCYDLAGYISETEAETDNAGAWLGVAWVKRRGKSSPADGYVVMSGEQFGALLLVLKKAGVEL